MRRSVVSSNYQSNLKRNLKEIQEKGNDSAKRFYQKTKNTVFVESLEKPCVKICRL